MLVSLHHRIKRAYASERSLVTRWRRARFRAMLERVRPPRGAPVVDLGGTEHQWVMHDHDFHVTLVNLPGSNVVVRDANRFELVEADACDLNGVFADASFDMVFSNSVIEHVGDETRQAMLAEQVRRLGTGYWVQTPSDRFPIEVHTCIPMYWRLPSAVKDRLHARWRQKLPGWFRMIETTRVLSRDHMRRLFPDARLYTERLFCCEKSYAAYRPCAMDV